MQTHTMTCKQEVKEKNKHIFTDTLVQKRTTHYVVLLLEKHKLDL